MTAVVRANTGAFATESQALDAIVSRLAAALDPQAIWLFGSRATGRARPDSDFDLLVVANADSAFGPDDYELVDRPIRDLRIGCDIVPCTKRDFEEGLALETSFVAQVVREGRQLYEARSHA